MWPGMWLMSRTGSVGWDLRKVSELSSASGEDVWLSALAEARQWASASVARVGVGVDGKVCIERWYLSPNVEKLFNSKVIKMFRAWTKKSCFLCFGIPMLYICALWTLWMFCVPVWICPFHISMSGYVTHTYFLCIGNFLKFQNILNRIMCYRLNK